MDRNEWLEARRQGIGGSDAAAIFGLSRWRSAIDVWRDKIGETEDREPTAAMLWGLRLEEPIARAFTEATGISVRKPARAILRARHVTGFPMIGSLDRVAENAVVELKTARSDAGFAPADSWRDVDPPARIPSEYYVQVQHYLEVTRRPLAYVAVLIHGSDFRVYEIPRDPDFGADLIEEEGRFWRDYVLARVQPPVGPDDLDYLARKYAKDDGTELVATAEQSLIVDAYLETVGELEALEGLRDGYRAKIEDAMGSATRLVSGSATVSWKAFDRTSTKWKEYAGVIENAFRAVQAAELEAIAAGFPPFIPETIRALETDAVKSIYTETKPVRPFRVDRKGES